VSATALSRFFKKLGGRYKRIRRRPKGKPLEEHYRLQIEKIKELEQMNEEGKTDLYYGDETHVCSDGYVPYGWQFPDEDVCILSEKAYKLNCFGFINRQNQCRWKITESNIDAQFMLEYMEDFSFQITRKTFVVLDNARVHKAKSILERIPYWQKRGLYLFFLPPYSPHLNIAETIWRKLKKEWLNPEDYLYKDNLFYAVNRCLAELGHNLMIKFSHFNIN
jgi:transposase